MARPSSERYCLALLRKTIAWEIEKWDLRQSAKTKANSLVEEQLGKLGEEEEEEKPATKQMRQYTDLGLDVGEREEEVACHALAFLKEMKKKSQRQNKEENTQI